MPSDSVDLIFTSPPYNKTGYRGGKISDRRWVGDIAYDLYEDNMEELKYREWQIQVLNECYRVIKPTGSILYNHKIRRSKSKASHPMEWILKSNAVFYQQITWDRGSTPDMNVNYLIPTTELIFWLVKDKPKCNRNIRDFSTEVWRIPPDSGNTHPAPFPLLLANVAILLTTSEGDVVLDPYVGSGTTALSAYKLNRKYIGIDISPTYCDQSISRINDEKNKLTLF